MKRGPAALGGAARRGQKSGVRSRKPGSRSERPAGLGARWSERSFRSRRADSTPWGRAERPGRPHFARAAPRPGTASVPPLDPAPAQRRLSTAPGPVPRVPVPSGGWGQRFSALSNVVGKEPSLRGARGPVQLESCVCIVTNWGKGEKQRKRVGDKKYVRKGAKQTERIWIPLTGCWLPVGNFFSTQASLQSVRQDLWLNFFHSMKSIHAAEASTNPLLVHSFRHGSLPSNMIIWLPL
ncbi:uncharacterized protein [Saccopteryx leptura]|uniref:uncharacterized protein n=1 Tax=Saccopteryx leptura TaxID=249018 RepID=UPI00339CBD67